MLEMVLLLNPSVSTVRGSGSSWVSLSLPQLWISFLHTCHTRPSQWQFITLSHQLNLFCGIPPGSVLGLILFVWYTPPLEELIKKCNSFDCIRFNHHFVLCYVVLYPKPEFIKNTHMSTARFCSYFILFSQTIITDFDYVFIKGDKCSFPHGGMI